MKVIAPVSNKGGVGKTFIARMLTEYYSMILNKRVLGIDFDPQCNYSRRFLSMETDASDAGGILPPVHPEYSAEEDGDEWDGRSSISDIFFGEGVYPYPSETENLEIAPGHEKRLLLAERVRKTEVESKIHEHLKQWLNLPEVRERYDVVIIDTAPSKGPLTIAAMRAASHIVIPVTLETQGMEGLFGMLQLWKQENFKRGKDEKLVLTGIVPNQVRPINQHRQILESLEASPRVQQYLVPMTIGLRSVFSEVDAHDNKPPSIFGLTESNKARQEALEFCEYLDKRIFTGEKVVSKEMENG